MRTFVGAGVAALVVALTGGCSGTGEAGETPPTDVTETSSPEPGGTDVADSEACQEVRSGIDAFNLGRFDETIEHFELAVPLAEDQDDGSEAAGQLVEAVRYYAELAAADYPEASRTSPDFARYKAITLGQCVAGATGTPESPGVEV